MTLRVLRQSGLNFSWILIDMFCLQHCIEPRQTNTWKEFGLALGFVEKYFLDELRRSIPNLL